jgi:hypothetical protein
MSVSASNLGTNYLTYSMNPDRSGQWAEYLSNLALQNGHDRMRYNGELNVKVGIIDKKPIPEAHLEPVDVDVKVPKVEKKVKAYKKRGYNPRYLHSGTG